MAPSLQTSTASLSTGERLSKLCVRPNCKRLANSFCTSCACKSCCLKVNGGCSGVRGHRPANTQSQHIPSVIPPPSQPTLTSSSPLFEIDPALSFDSFAELLRQDNPVLRLRDECSSQAAAERQAASREAQLEAQEDAEFQKAIAESLRSPPSSPITSTPSLRDPQPMPPTATVLTMGGLPVTRVTTSNRPTITMQMSKDWMCPYEDKSKQAQAAQQSPSKRQIDKEVIEKFRIVWWEKVHCLNLTLIFLFTCLRDDDDPAVFTILDCPCWPKWKVTDSPSALKCLGTDTFEFYDLDHKIWVEAPVSYPHMMMTDSYLFLRRPGVSCKDFREHLVIAMQTPTTSRVYMTKLRQSVKSKITINKEKMCASQWLKDSEGEVEFVGSQSQSIQAHKQPHLSPLIIPSSPIWRPSSSPISIEDSPSQTPPTSLSSTSASTNLLFTFSTMSSPSQTPLTSAAPSTPSPIAASFEFTSPSGAGPPALMPGKLWPHNMYLRDMAAGFLEMDRLKKLRFLGGFQGCFEKVFGQKAPNRSTYHDQLKRWNLVAQSVRDAATVAERNSAGHWSSISKTIPLKK